MVVYIIATISTVLLIALIAVLAIVMIASQLWITNANPDTGVGRYSIRKNTPNNPTKKLHPQAINKLIERVIRHTVDDRHFDNL